MSVAELRIEQILTARGPGKTLCPSEVARDLAGEGGDWRARMRQVHEAVDTLVARERIALSWKGQPLPARDGPYRIAAPQG